MSRCFPFPPPGYEKKARTDDVDLLKKEKHREKKHKKEKKDKEKRESKEKREKDRSDGKHREKKDKKEKHRDKKKDKEKDGDPVKDKFSTSDDKRIQGKTESHGAEKLIHKAYKDNCVDKRDIGQVGGYQAEKLSQNRLLAEQNQNSELFELGRKTKDEARAIGNQLVEKITESGGKDEGMVRLVAEGTDILAEVKEKHKDKRVDVRKTEGQGVKGAARVSGNTMVQNPAGLVETKMDGIPRPFESNVDRKIDAKKEGDDKRGDKRKDKDREKKKQGRDKDKDKEKKKEAKAKEKNESRRAEPNKEKKKEEKAKEKNESKNGEPDKLKKSNKEDLRDSNCVITTQLSKDSNKSSDADENHKKRKDLKANGILHDLTADDIRPSKMPRHSSSSNPLMKNGKTQEPCQTSIPYVSEGLGAANNVKDNKDRKINGIIEAPTLSVSPAKPSSIAAQADPAAEASMRAPHPDSRYVSKVYLVPNVDVVPDDDDQDWLFGSSDTQSKRPKVESSWVEETPEVWSEALRIESADVHALPYVIPY